MLLLLLIAVVLGPLLIALLVGRVDDGRARRRAYKARNLRDRPRDRWQDALTDTRR